MTALQAQEPDAPNRPPKPRRETKVMTISPFYLSFAILLESIAEKQPPSFSLHRENHLN
jgi:hypothetical protein